MQETKYLLKKVYHSNKKYIALLIIGSRKKSDFCICQTCNVKWICENCALYCHVGHTIKPQLKNHQSDWAICYCITKCDCKAINKNNVQEG